MHELLTTTDTLFEPVIGLEVHAQLTTQSKLFCSCSTAFGATPNQHTCEVCLGMPGVLPSANQQAVSLGIRAGLGLNCTIHPVSEWSRKNYFYADLPKGYQITQFSKPLATKGHVILELAEGTKRIGITRIHLEEDAGKNIHEDLQITALKDRSYVDFNRGGIPLIEIVSEPDLRSAKEAATYMKTLRQILRYLGVCDGNMEEGSLRCDANVSLRPKGTTKLGTRTELKNINSFKFVENAIDYEIVRQTAVLLNGEKVLQETRLWDSQAKCTRSLRSKEEAHDYRYFPEPDLPQLILSQDFIAAIQRTVSELPQAKKNRYIQEFGLSPYDAGVLTEDLEVANFFEAALTIHNNYKQIANWIMSELLRELKGKNVREFFASCQLTGQALGELVKLIDEQVISGKMAKDIFPEMLTTSKTAQEIINAKGLKQVVDSQALRTLVEQIASEHPEVVSKYRAGKENVLGFLVGKVMQATKGQAHPALVNELFKEYLANDQ